MRIVALLLPLYRLLGPALAEPIPIVHDGQERLLRGDSAGGEGVSIGLFSSLERMSRLVDISYCVGMSGVSRPFNCISRCKDFPSLTLVTTWNTGVLMGDSCGYIAVDHGVARPGMASQGELRGEDDGEKAIIVAFRGTYSLSNTVVDLSSVPQEYVPYPSPDEPKHKCTNCTVHMGFLSSWRNARKKVLPVLETLREEYPGYPILLVGHSLGGAVAALAALELKASLQWDDIVVTTFGEPRIGNEGLARFINDVFELDADADAHPEERTYRRVTHVDDPVPLLPLSEWGFRPHAGEIFIAKSGLPPEPEDLTLCVGNDDARCLDGEDADDKDGGWWARLRVPGRFRVWELLFAHRDYFWRLGLCVPGGDPHDWGRERYQLGDSKSDEL
ncbi:related to triacylglycerol lipase [Cephalotrichum gorgonifer]|uniref:Related to triacylglycerol lipase n=1 Tax=Cephalotrichum gorgonifer TaxID=2041049 RepID=A0AAE8SQR6_9PEZI|nr:related to triacylglycerol lipase [Cephalotrichum gorgonifer]